MVTIIYFLHIIILKWKINIKLFKILYGGNNMENNLSSLYLDYDKEIEYDYSPDNSIE